MNQLARIEEQLFTQYYQFYVADSASWDAQGSDVDTASADFWSPDAIARGLAVATGVLGVGTASFDTVSVVVEVTDARPRIAIADFDRVVEAPLSLTSGALLVIGCAAPEGSTVLGLPMGWYRVMVCSAGLALGAAAGEGGDSYALWMWPARQAPAKVTKPFIH
jgi:hypothetical protein